MKYSLPEKEIKRRYCAMGVNLPIVHVYNETMAENPLFFYHFDGNGVGITAKLPVAQKSRSSFSPIYIVWVKNNAICVKELL